jgi:hypothetical protein
MYINLPSLIQWTMTHVRWTCALPASLLEASFRMEVNPKTRVMHNLLTSSCKYIILMMTRKHDPIAHDVSRVNPCVGCYGPTANIARPIWLFAIGRNIPRNIDYFVNLVHTAMPEGYHIDKPSHRFTKLCANSLSTLSHNPNRFDNPLHPLSSYPISPEIRLRWCSSCGS